MALEWMKKVDAHWTLFLDRDGVINERLPGAYVKHPDEFTFLPGAIEAIVSMNRLFGTTLVVTNQQGIGKGLMTAADLHVVHEEMQASVKAAGGNFDAIFYCPELAAGDPPCRKPNPGMAMQAKAQFPIIDFERSVMVGDSPSDMEFGERLGMKTVFIGERDQGLCFERLEQFAAKLFVCKE